MKQSNVSDDPSVVEAVHMLRQILSLYKMMGPQSMESLTKSYLAAAPSIENAEDEVEKMMAQAFKIFDKAADSLLRRFAERQGFDLSTSKNYIRRMEEGYFRVGYPFIVMYIVWLDREGQQKAVDNIGMIFESMMLGIAGYMILDSILDEQIENPAEVLLSLSFIQENDRLMLESFNLDMNDYELLNRFKQLYLLAEIKEKSVKFIRSPYTIDHPEDCGYKAVQAYLPFALLLQKSGKKDQIDDYLEFFYEWGAPLQIMDDLIDLEDDLKHGHYSYPTLGYEQVITSQSPAEAAKIIRSNTEHIKRLQTICMELIDSSRDRCNRLKADLLGYFVDILEERLQSYFVELLKTQ